MTTIGMQSRAAFATPVAALVSPGLRWLRTTEARPADACVSVRGVGGDLLVTHVDEVDPAVGHGREHGDVGVPAEAEDAGDATPFEVLDELFGRGRMASSHAFTPLAPAAALAFVDKERPAGPRYVWLIGSTRRIGAIV